MQYITREKGYYLPLGYNDNKIVLLVRDPLCLFAYWEISNDKKQNFINQFGQDSWNNSKPVIKLTNKNNGIVKYIEINDFANNWYIEVEQANCMYSAEIGRMVDNNSFISLAASNTAKAPSNKPSKNRSVVFANYKNVKSTTKKTNVKTALEKYDYNNFEYKNNITRGLSSAELSGLGSLGGKSGISGISSMSSISGISSDSLIK